MNLHIFKLASWVTALMLTCLAAQSSFAQAVCASRTLTPYDLQGYRPIGSSTVPSANAGAVEQIPVTNGSQACVANVRCEYYGNWQTEYVNCNTNTYSCQPRTYTVYDLGGWTPLGGQYYA